MTDIPGKVNEAQLKNAYHTTIFGDERVPELLERRLVAMDINPENNERPCLWYQDINKFADGDVLSGGYYSSENITDPIQLRADAIQCMKDNQISFTEDQLDKIFAQGGYLEPEKVMIDGKYIQARTTAQQDRFKLMSVEDLQPLVRHAYEEKIRGLSATDLLAECEINISNAKFKARMRQAIIDKNLDPLINELLYRANWHLRTTLGENTPEGTTNQARFLFANGMSVEELLGLKGKSEADAPQFLSIITLGGFKDWKKTPSLSLLVRSPQNAQDLQLALAETPIGDWVLSVSQPKDLHLPVDCELKENNVSSLAAMIGERVEQFKNEHLAQVAGEHNLFHFHCKTGEVVGPLYQTPSFLDAPIKIDVDEYVEHYKESFCKEIVPGDTIDIRDLCYTTVGGEKKDPENGRNASQDDDENRMR